MIIGLSGKAGSGKDTVAKIIKENTNLEVRILAFGDAVKDITGELLGIDRDTIERYKREDLLISGFPIRIWLQKVGTLFRNEVDHNYWIHFVLDKFQADWEHKLIIITDVRYINEAQAVKSFGGKIARINRSIEDVNTHKSEIDLDDYKSFDYIIDNTSNVLDLKNNVLEVLKDIL